MLTKEFNIPEDRIYVTVFEGDKSEGLEFDQEAFDVWKTCIDADRIINGNKKIISGRWVIRGLVVRVQKFMWICVQMMKEKNRWKTISECR